MPVITSTRGLCVASTRWMPTARAFCASRMTESSTSAGATIIRSASSSITHTTYGSGGSPLCSRARLSSGSERVRASDIVPALLHLLDQVLERVRGHPRTRDHRGEQVRDRLVVVELDLLGVDMHKSDLMRRGS